MDNTNIDMLKVDQLKKVINSINTYSNDLNISKNTLISNMNSLCLEGRDDANRLIMNKIVSIGRETDKLSKMLKTVALDIENVSREILKVTQK